MSEHEQDDGIDLDALDEDGGMEAALAKFRQQSASKAVGPKRPAWISGLVVVMGAALCVAMWADFRYWLNFEIDSIGDAESLDRDALEAHENRYVGLSGTPDVNHVVPVPLMDGRKLSLTRIQGADGQLFILGPSPVSEGGGSYVNEFSGRLRQASKLESYDALSQVYALEGVTQSEDLAREGLEDALANRDGVVSTADEHSIVLRPEDRLVLVARPDLVMLQLGRRTWKTPAEARAAVESLDAPYLPLADTQSVHDDPDAVLPNQRAFYKYLVALPPSRVAPIEEQLNEGVDLGDQSDPSIGALILPQIATYTTRFDALVASEAGVRFEYADNAASPGADVHGGKLQLRTIENGELLLPWSELQAVRLERPVEIGPEASVLLVDRTPGEKLPIGLSFIVVLGIVAANLGGLIVGLRRKES